MYSVSDQGLCRRSAGASAFARPLRERTPQRGRCCTAEEYTRFGGVPSRGRRGDFRRVFEASECGGRIRRSPFRSGRTAARTGEQDKPIQSKWHSVYRVGVEGGNVPAGLLFSCCRLPGPLRDFGEDLCATWFFGRRMPSRTNLGDELSSIWPAH